MRKKRLPKELQGTLWSVNVNKLDLEKDKGYIIHQIFSYGKMEEIRWLLKTYPKKIIIKIFTTYPYKDYRAARFNFIKNHLLNLKNLKINLRHYVKDTPRNLR